MSGRYLTDLADVCRRAGLTVIEVGSGPSRIGPEWKNRARSSGGYGSGRPTHVMIHHTASAPSADGWGDANYCTFSSDNRPVCNLLLSRKGEVFVCAAGATNTNGSGGPIDNVPQDSMNTYAIGVEASNQGTGEPWPQAQQEAYTRLANALLDVYNLPHCRSHAEYAPTRKIDPAGASRWAVGSATWNEDGFRSDVAAGWPDGSAAPTIVKEKPMIVFQYVGQPDAWWITDGINYRRAWSFEAMDVIKVWQTFLGYPSNLIEIQQLSKDQLDAVGRPLPGEPAIAV